MPHSVFIKSMVCNRCKLVVGQLFKDFNIPTVDVQLGEVTLERELTKDELTEIKPRLEQFGFELIDNNGAKIATKIKSLLIELIESGRFDVLYAQSKSHTNAPRHGQGLEEIRL